MTAPVSFWCAIRDWLAWIRLSPRQKGGSLQKPILSRRQNRQTEKSVQAEGLQREVAKSSMQPRNIFTLYCYCPVSLHRRAIGKGALAQGRVKGDNVLKFIKVSVKLPLLIIGAAVAGVFISGFVGGRTVDSGLRQAAAERLDALAAAKAMSVQMRMQVLRTQAETETEGPALRQAIQQLTSSYNMAPNVQETIRSAFRGRDDRPWSERIADDGSRLNVGYGLDHRDVHARFRAAVVTGGLVDLLLIDEIGRAHV